MGTLPKSTPVAPGGPSTTQDGDGVPDNLDPDSDGDGIADAEESTGDSDSDGIPDYLEDNIKRSKTRTVMAYPTPRTPMLTATAFQTHRRALAMPTVTASPTTSCRPRLGRRRQA